MAAPTFGEWIRSNRELSGISQERLAELCPNPATESPYTKSYIANIERSVQPAPDHMISLLCQALDLPEDVGFLRAGKLPPRFRSLRQGDAQIAFAVAAMDSVLFPGEGAYDDR